VFGSLEPTIMMAVFKAEGRVSGQDSVTVGCVPVLCCVVVCSGVMEIVESNEIKKERAMGRQE
jgi:hypothetical protein